MYTNLLIPHKKVYLSSFQTSYRPRHRNCGSWRIFFCISALGTEVSWKLSRRGQSTCSRRAWKWRSHQSRFCRLRLRSHAYRIRSG